MSVDSTALERSALERKDRDELLTIAKALGGKPPARAKKADIVDLVLQLTGVEGHAAADAPAEPGSEPEATPKPRATRARKATAAAPEEPADDAGAVEEPPAEWEAEAAAAPEEAESAPDEAAPQGRQERQDRGGQNGQQGRQDRGGSAGRQGGGNGGNGGQGHDRGGNGGNQGQDRGGNQAQGGQGQGDEDEGGNRRRRRRGRNRERDAGPAAVGGALPEEYTGEPIDVEGHLDLRDEGYGFLRLRGYLPSRDDVYVSVKQARQFGLRKGDHLKGASRPALRNEKNPALLRIDLVNGEDPEKARERPSFDELTPLFPDTRLTLENTSDPTNMTARIIDLISPIGKGQRGLIVSPPARKRGV
jgi:transcription termination factor Rho